MSCGSGIKFVNYSLFIEIPLQKLRLGPRAITMLICQALLTCWRNGMEVSSGHRGGVRGRGCKNLIFFYPKVL